jgi:GDPmannose 4,6-dehydratase
MDYVVMDPKFIRPAEVDLLLGDCAKAKETLGWKQEVSFTRMIQMMVEADMRRVEWEFKTKLIPVI